MRKSIKTSVMLIASLAMVSLVLSFTTNNQEGGQDAWEVPAAANKLKNPTKGTAEEIAIGKSLYAQHCKSCHGKTGKGDGSKSEELDTFSGDFSTAGFQDQTDGALFYKINEGRDDMPSYKKKISEDEDRWIIVNYLRTLGGE